MRAVSWAAVLIARAVQLRAGTSIAKRHGRFFEKLDGFVPIYWDSGEGKIFSGDRAVP